MGSSVAASLHRRACIDPCLKFSGDGQSIGFDILLVLVLPKLMPTRGMLTDVSFPGRDSNTASSPNCVLRCQAVMPALMVTPHGPLLHCSQPSMFATKTIAHQLYKHTGGLITNSVYLL